MEYPLKLKILSMVLTVVTLSHCSEEVVSHHEIYQQIQFQHFTTVVFCFGVTLR